MIMSIYKARELRAMPKEELNDKLKQLEKELNKENSAIASSTKPENPGKIREIKRTIARILTIKREKEEVQQN